MNPRIYAWMDEETDGRLVIRMPGSVTERVEQATRIMNLASVSAAWMAREFSQASPDTMPEFLALGQAAEVLRAAFTRFHEVANAEIAKRVAEAERDLS